MKSKKIMQDPVTILARTAQDLSRQFSLKPETDYTGTLEQVRADVEFCSGNIWALIFAILIASVGLNVNSTAVIIGAMLISPLMGPIVGAGFGLATNDFSLLRRSLRNLLLATTVGLVTSALYFAISPLEDAQSELLARVRPTLYDVLIALFGGGAGVVAVSRKTGKGNVVPGVAIATALMPPLCTAGFGLAQGNWWFLIGAFHLYLINALFICLATVAFVRLMDFSRLEDPDPSHVIRTRIIVIFVTLGIALPSAYTAWVVVHETRFQQRARKFVAESFDFSDRSVLNVTPQYSREGSTIRVTLLGQPLSDEDSKSLQRRLVSYGLEGTNLLINQPTASSQSSLEQLSRVVRQGVLEDLYGRNEQALQDRDTRIRTLEEELVKIHASQFPVREVASELVALYPSLISLGIGREVKAVDASNGQVESTVVVLASWKNLPSENEQNKLRDFLIRRLGVDSLRLVHSTSK